MDVPEPLKIGQPLPDQVGQRALVENLDGESNLPGSLGFVPGSGTLADELENQDMGRVISQFGWHFERQVIPQGGGPQFVVEFVPLLAGVEYGKFIPNLTLAMGVRTPGGIEFGMGPNVFFSKTLVNSPLTMKAGIVAP